MRNEIYLELINNTISKLLNFQDVKKNSITEGCFFYPYWRLRKENYVNSRWQESVLSLSWFYNRYNSEDLWNRCVKGIDFWCKLQHKNGAFPEYCRSDRSFSATAFSTLAIINSIILLNYSKEKWLDKIKKSCDYLIKNDELFFINQEMAASLALLKVGNYIHDLRYIKESEIKLDKVLKSQSIKGYYKENNGFDFGYSTLTLELLGHYYLITNDQNILNSASKFIDLVVNINLNSIKNIRRSNWVIVDGFEIFCDKTTNGREALKKILNNFNIQHIEFDGNLCTDLYRLCHAYDNYKEELEHKELEINSDFHKEEFTKPSKILNILRPFGIHNFRRYKSFFN